MGVLLSTKGESRGQIAEHTRRNTELAFRSPSHHYVVVWKEQRRYVLVPDVSAGPVILGCIIFFVLAIPALPPSPPIDFPL
jgi:hypothetical protein